MKKKIFTMILVVVVLFSVVALLEFGSRYYIKNFLGLDFVYLRHEYDAYRNHRLTPNYSFKGVKHNAQGFRRITDVTLSKPTNTFRIFLMGASVAYGVGPAYPYPRAHDSNQITNKKTIDYYLENYLNSKIQGEKIEVINAAVTGYWTHHHLIYLIQKVLKFKPDMVLFLDGHADYYHVNYDQFDSYYYGGRRVMDMMNDRSISALFHLIAEWLKMRSYFLYASQTVLKLGYQSKRLGQMDHLPFGSDLIAEYRKTSRKNFLRMIEYISLILQHKNIKFVFMLQPEIVLDSKPMTLQEQKSLEITMNRQRIDIKKLKPHTVELMQNIMQKHKGKFLDLTNIYAGVTGQVYTDYAHLTPLGNQLLAEYVGSQLSPLLKTPTKIN